MADFKISIDLEVLKNSVQSIIDETVLPALTQAVFKIARQAQINWTEAVYRANLRPEEKDAYMASIQIKPTGPFSALVWSDYKYAEDIEIGRPARDLKQMLNTSQKVRISKKGNRYMFIPFRHNTPGSSALGSSMPSHVFALASQLKSSSITGQVIRTSGLMASSLKTKQLMTTKRNTYQWGGRLAAGSMGPNPKGKVDRYAGMYKFNTSTPGGGKYSSYMTFRTMSEKSNGWIIPQQPGLFLAKKVADQLKPIAQKEFSDAIKKT